MANRSKKQLLLKENPYTTSLIITLMDDYGPEAFNWDLETIQMEWEEVYDVKLQDMTRNKLAAGLQIMTSDDFFRSLPDYIFLSNILAGGMPELWRPVGAYDLTSAVAEVRLLNPPDTDLREAFDAEIIGYTAIVLREHKILTPPDSLNFIPVELLANLDINAIAEDPVLYQAVYNDAVDESQRLQNYENQVMQDLLFELYQLQLETGSMKTLFYSK